MLMSVLLVSLIVVQILFLCAAIIACGVIVVGSISLGYGVPFVRTPPRLYPLIAKALDIQQGDVVCELGSGDGGFALWLARECPSAHVVGIERNPLLYRLSRMRVRWTGNPSNIEFRQADFFDMSFAETNKIYAYLLESALERLLPAFERDLSGAVVATRAFQLTGKKRRDAVRISDRAGLHGEHMLYVYDF